MAGAKNVSLLKFLSAGAGSSTLRGRFTLSREQNHFFKGNMAIETCLAAIPREIQSSSGRLSI